MYIQKGAGKRISAAEMCHTKLDNRVRRMTENVICTPTDMAKNPARRWVGDVSPKERTWRQRKGPHALSQQRRGVIVVSSTGKTILGSSPRKSLGGKKIVEKGDQEQPDAKKGTSSNIVVKGNHVSVRAENLRHGPRRGGLPFKMNFGGKKGVRGGNEVG